MNQKHIKLLGAAFLSICLCLYPISAFASVSGSQTIDPGLEYHILLPADKHIEGSVTMDGIMDIFITNMSGITYWQVNKTIPPYALLNFTGASEVGFTNVYIPDSFYYLVLGNNGTSQVFVEWELTMSMSMIPGFEFMYALFAVIAIFGFIYVKKKSIL